MVWNDFLSSEWFAWSGTIVAALFFGSNYVIVKKFPTGDGFGFQWVWLSSSSPLSSDAWRCPSPF